MLHRNTENSLTSFYQETILDFDLFEFSSCTASCKFINLNSNLKRALLGFRYLKGVFCEDQN